MKVIVLGACADMAVPFLPALLREKDVTGVTLADRDAEGLRRCLPVGDPRCRVQVLDASRKQDLVEALRGHDVAAGFVGPFYRFEAPIARACIEAGCHYVSIADDYDAFLAVSALHEEARRAGVTVITGLGNSPGLTNLLALKGYQSLDRADRIHIAWTGGSDEDVGPANVLHVMHIFEGQTMQWRDGHPVLVPCGSDPREVTFPPPIGRQVVFVTGHAESVSLPRYLPGLQEVTLHGGIRPVWVARLATALGRLGLTSTDARRRALARLLSPVMGVFSMGGSADRSVFRIEVHGVREGRPAHRCYEGVGPIAQITSMPLLEGVLAVGRGEVRRRGVFPPEGILNPDTFLPRVQARGVEIRTCET